MRLRNLILILIFVIFPFTRVAATTQKKPIRRQKTESVRIKKNKPTVYLTLIKAIKIEPLHTGEGEEHVWLRLHNNTKWIIWLQASGVPNSNYGDISAYYDIENYNTGSKVILNTCHVCSTMQLASGKTFDFVIPQEYLVPGQRMRIFFSYDWENRKDVFAGREAEHSVLFYDADLKKRSK